MSGALSLTREEEYSRLVSLCHCSWATRALCRRLEGKSAGNYHGVRAGVAGGGEIRAPGVDSIAEGRAERLPGCCEGGGGDRGDPEGPPRRPAGSGGSSREKGVPSRRAAPHRCCPTAAAQAAGRLPPPAQSCGPRGERPGRAPGGASGRTDATSLRRPTHFAGAFIFAMATWGARLWRLVCLTGRNRRS